MNHLRVVPLIIACLLFFGHGQTSVSSSLPMWYITSGPFTELRRMTVDGSMIEQVMISNLAAPNSSSVKWIAVQDGVAFWTDSFSCPGLRKFDPKTALLGQRRSTLLEDSTGILSFGSVAPADGDSIYVTEQTNGSILRVLKSSGTFNGSLQPYQIVKSGFARDTLQGLVSYTNSTRLFWLVSDGVQSALCSGLTNDKNWSVVLDLTTLDPPSFGPTTLALDEKQKVLIWVDRGQNGLYRLDLPSKSVKFLGFNSSKDRTLHGATISASTGRIFVSFEDLTIKSAVARIFEDFSGVEEIVFSEQGSFSCCGLIRAIVLQHSFKNILCSAGTFGPECQPCANNSFSSKPFQSNCSGVCIDSQYCEFGAARPIPRYFAQNSSFSNAQLFSLAIFGDIEIPLYFLVGFLSLVGFLTLFMGLLIVVARLRKYETIYPKLKNACQKIDICFRSKHYNETPALMLHRKSIIGGFQTILYPTLFIMLAIYVFLLWNSSPIIQAAVVPFSHLDSPAELVGFFSVSALFWGYSGQCDLESATVNVTGLSEDITMNVTVEETRYYCNVTWDTMNNRSKLAFDAVILVTMNGGHTSFLGYEVAVGPHYLRGVRKKDSDGSIRGFFEEVNYMNGTILPKRIGSLFKGLTPTNVIIDVTWAQLNDTTIGARIESQKGWLLGSVNVLQGGEVKDAIAFSSAQNSASIQFTLARSPFYLRVLVQPTGSFAVVFGSILAFTFTINNGLAMAGKTLEWMMVTCCKKQRNKTQEFFMRPYEGPELEAMAGFKNYNTDENAVRIMHRNDKTKDIESVEIE